MHCIKTGCVAVVCGVRLRGDAFLVSNSANQAALFDEPAHTLPATHWLLLRISGERTAVEDWNDFGPNDHIIADTYDSGFSDRPIRTMLLAPNTWRWLGYNGQPTT